MGFVLSPSVLDNIVGTSMLPLLLLYAVGWTDDAWWIRRMMSCIVAPHVGPTLSDRQMWPYSFRVIRLDR